MISLLKVLGRCRRVSVSAAVLAAAVLAVPSQTARADVLAQAPADALAVVVVNDWGRTNAKMAQWAKDAGLQQLQPQMADPLGAMMREAGFNEGIEKGGDVGVAIMAPTGDGEEPVAVGLIPVSDYKAFLGNFEEVTDAGDGVSSFTNRQGETNYAAQWGAYAAISDNQAALTRANTGVKPTGRLAPKEIEGKDFVLYANMPALKAKLLPELKANRQRIIDDAVREIAREGGRGMGAQADIEDMNAEGAEGGDDPAAADGDADAGDEAGQMTKAEPLVRSGMSQLLNAAERFLTDAEATTFSLTLTDRGLNGTVMAEFAQGSYLGTNVAALKGENGSLLAGLPVAKYLAVSGFSVDPAAASKLLGDVIDQVLTEVKNMGPDFESIAGMLEAYKQSGGAARSVTSGWVAPQGQLGAEGILQIVQIARGDATKLKQMMRSEINNPFGAMQLQGNLQGVDAPGGDLTVTENVKTIEGVAFDQIKAELDMAGADNAEAANVAQGMAIMFGPEGYVMNAGQLNNDAVVAGIGVSDEVLASLVRSAKAGEDTVASAAGIKATSAQLPADGRVMVAYVNLDQIIQTGLTYAQMFGFPVQVQMPENLSPIGMSASIDGPALRFDGHLPTDLVRGVVNAAQQAMGGMMGGGGPGGAPGGEGDGGDGL